MRKKVLKKMTVLAMAVMMAGSVMTAHAEDGIYTVKRGDNLSKIAKEVYGSRNEWRTIYEANKSSIKNADIVYAGQQLVLPGASAGTAQQAVPEQDPAAGAVQETAPEAVQGNTAVENNRYRLNIALEKRYTIIGTEIPLLEMGTAEIFYYKSAKTFYDESEAALYPAPEGYEWRATDVAFGTRGGVFAGNYFYNHCTFSGENVESTWERVEDGPGYYDEYNFTLHYNGTDYTQCKVLSAISWGEDELFSDFLEGNSEYLEEGLVMNLLVLVPKGYDGHLNYTMYGTQLVDGQVVRNDAEYIVIPF